MDERSRSGSERHRFFLRAAGNVFIVAALAVAAYVPATWLRTGLSQRSLLAAAPPSMRTAAAEVDAGPVLDFEGWEREDRAYWTKLERGGVFGRIVVPSIKLDRVVVKGTSSAELRRGPGWLAATDLPGAEGNAAISGHRTTYGAPFWSLDKVRPGDVVYLQSPFRRYTYVVEASRIVRPGRSALLSHTVKPTLTLTACHPRYSAARRIVVTCRLREVRRLRGAPKKTE